MNKILSTILGAAVFLGCQPADAQTPFPTGVNIALTKPGMNSAAKNYTLYTQSVASSSAGTFTAGTSFTPTYDIDGIGLNPIDHLLYGASYVGADNTMNNNVGVSLRRIGADGTVVDLGLLPTSGQTSMEFPNFAAGTISSTGSYYYMSFGLKPSGITKVAIAMALQTQPNLNASDIRIFLCWKDNVSTLPANAGNNIAGGLSGYYEIDFSNAQVTAAMNAFLAQVNAQYPNVYNANGGIQDFAINPVDSKIYGYISYPSGSTTVGRPVVLNAPASGIAAIVPVGTTVNSLPGQEVSGVQFDATGNFYGLFTTGHYAQIDLSTGALTGLAMSNIPLASGNLRGDLAAASTTTPLFLNLLSFTGQQTGATHTLNWVTTSEQHKGFDVERSTDGRDWSALGFVAGRQDGSEAGNTYHFTDILPAAGKNYYRIKEIGNNGTVTYSSTLLLNHQAGATYTIYPNPARNQVSVSGLKTGDKVRLTNLSGQFVLEQETTGALNIGHIAPGTYFIQVITDGHAAYATKFVKL